jgi:hypothetical protein
MSGTEFPREELAGSPSHMSCRPHFQLFGSNVLLNKAKVYQKTNEVPGNDEIIVPR